MLEAEDNQSITPSEVPSRPPLGLPNGSVRALLTLMIATVVILQLCRGVQVELLWTETLMIALAHYFTSRRLIKLPPEVIAKLTSEGKIDEELRPLFLPRYTIRIILIAAFLGVAVYLFHENRLFHSQALSILGVVFAYVLGVVARIRTVRGWENLKALVVLSVTICTAGAYLIGRPDLVPQQLRDVTLGLTLFYFGSR